MPRRVTATAHESTDGFVWSTCGGTAPQVSLASDNTEYSVVATISKRYFRLKLTLGGTDPIGTCWVTGAFELRVA